MTQYGYPGLAAYVDNNRYILRFNKNVWQYRDALVLSTYYFSHPFLIAGLVSSRQIRIAGWINVPIYEKHVKRYWQWIRELDQNKHT